MAKKKSIRTVVKVNNKKKSIKNDHLKILIIAAVIIAIILVAAVGVGIATGKITTDEITTFINSILGEPKPSPSPSPSTSPSPSPISGEWSDNILLIGNPLTGQTMDIHFIDVGQGDCILIEFPDGKNMLIDGGDTRNATRDAILAYLLGQEIVILDYVMLTHTDADHLGALDDVLIAYPVKNLFIPNLIASNGMEDATTIPGSISTVAFKNFMDRVALETYMDGETEVPATIVYNENIIIIEEADYKLSIYCPPPEYYLDIKNTSSAAKKNNMSPVCVLEYGGRTVIFSGDADLEAEQRFVDMIGDAIDADVLKVGHHGSTSSSNDFFLAHIDVEFAIISCGEGNTHDHPRQGAIDRLLASGVEYLFRTDMHSDIMLQIDSTGNMQFSVKTFVTMDVVIVGFGGIE